MCEAAALANPTTSYAFPFNDSDPTDLKLWILSDLHLETVPYPGAFKPPPPEFDVLVSAGDVWSGNFEQGFAFVRNLAGAKPVIMTLGNHEHWRGEITETIAAARRAAASADIHLLEGDRLDILGVRFIGATLWSDYELGGDIDLRKPTGEEIRVRDGSQERSFAACDARLLHLAARERLRIHIASESSLPRVVVTHHAPHPACLGPAEIGQWIAGNCASDLSKLTDDGSVHLWVHGHIHRSIDLRRPGGTRIICNPAGALFANPGFDERLTVEVDK